MRMSELLNEVNRFELDEGFSPKEIKMAIGIASDPRYKGGNMTGATNAIDKIKKGLSDHPKVAAVLRRQNEDTNEAVSPAQQAAIAISKKEKAKEEGVELDEYLTPDEKKLIAKMYDKKGNLTPLGKKVMDYKIKKEEVENTEEGFSSDAQRRAAFASGYKAKGKKGKKDKKEEVDESTKEYAKSMEKMANKAKKDQLTSKDLDTLAKLVQLMQKQTKEEIEEVEETLDKEDEPKLKRIVKKLKKASDAHAGQASDLEKAMSESKMKELASKIADVYMNMKKDSTMKPFADKFRADVKKSLDIRKSLEKVLPDYVGGGKITDLVKEEDELDETMEDEFGERKAPKVDPAKYAAHMAKSKKPKRMSSTQKTLSSISKRADKMSREEIDLDNEDESCYIDEDSQSRMKDSAMNALHRLVQSKGSKSSLGSHAFEIAKSYENLDGRELEKMYVDKYGMPEEDVKVIEGYFPEGKSSTGYELFHNTLGGAIDTAVSHAKSKFGISISDEERMDKVGLGPRKPSKGKTNSYRLMGTDKSGKSKGVQVQVYNMGNKFELNMYKESIDEEVELDEAGSQGMFLVIQGPGDNNQKVVSIHKRKQEAIKARNSWNDKNGDGVKKGKRDKPIPAHLARVFAVGEFATTNGKPDSYKVGDSVSYTSFQRSLVKEEVELDEKNMKIGSIDFQLFDSMKGSKTTNMAMNKEIGRASQMKDYKTARAYMDKVQRKYSKFGAEDSEPERTIDAVLKKSFKESIDEASKEGTIKIIDLGKGKGFQLQRMTKGKFVNQGKPYKSQKDAEKVRKDGQHSMQFETIDESVKFAGMPAGLSKERIKADRDVYAQVLGIKEAIDPADFDISATGKDKEQADKNVLIQLSKVITLKNAHKGVEFADGSKQKVHPNVAAAALSMHQKLRRTDQKDAFQNKIGKSYKDLLNAVKGK